MLFFFDGTLIMAPTVNEDITDFLTSIIQYTIHYISYHL